MAARKADAKSDRRARVRSNVQKEWEEALWEQVGEKLCGEGWACWSDEESNNKRGSADMEGLLRERLRWVDEIAGSEKGTRGETRKLSWKWDSALVGRVWRRGDMFLKRRHSMVGQKQEKQRRRGAYEVEKGQDNVFCSPALAPRGRRGGAREAKGPGRLGRPHPPKDAHHIHKHASRARCEMCECV